MSATLHPLEPTPRERTRGRLLVLTAAILWSTCGFFAKAPLFGPWPIEHRGIHLAFWRALFACLFVLPLIRRPRWHVGLVPMALIFAAMNYTYLTAMTRTTDANAIWLQSVAPAWVFLVGVFVLGERREPGDWMLVLCGALGVGFILFHESQGEQLAGVVFGVLSGVTYAGVVLCVRQLRRVDAAWLIALNLGTTALLLSPIVVADGIWPTPKQFAYLTAFGMLQLGLPYFLFARGLRSVSGHEASGIALLEPILVPVWVFLAWHAERTYEPPRWWTYVGGSMILVGLLWRYVVARRLRRPGAGEIM